MEKKKSREERFYDMLANYKWPDGFVCRKCGNNTFTTHKGGAIKRCKSKECKNAEESVIAYTAFHGLKFDLEKAFDLIDYYVQCFMDIDTEEQAIEVGTRVKRTKLGTEVDYYNVGKFISIQDIAERYVEKDKSAQEQIDRNLVKMNFKHFREENNLSKEELKEAWEELRKTDSTTNEHINRYFAEYKIMNDENELLYAAIEKRNVSMVKKAEKYFASKVPTVEDLSIMFDIEENTASKFLKTLCERMEIIEPSNKGFDFTFMDHLRHAPPFSVMELIKEFMVPIYPIK